MDMFEKCEKEVDDLIEKMSDEIFLETVEIKVKSELYGVTDCVINVQDYKDGRLTFPCGDGCDYRLTKADEKKLDELIKLK